MKKDWRKDSNETIGEAAARLLRRLDAQRGKKGPEQPQNGSANSNIIPFPTKYRVTGEKGPEASANKGSAALSFGASFRQGGRRIEIGFWKAKEALGDIVG